MSYNSMFNTIVAVFFALPVCRCTKVHLIQCVLVCFMFFLIYIDNNVFYFFLGQKLQGP
jgi:hypothetical protein